MHQQRLHHNPHKAWEFMSLFYILHIALSMCPIVCMMFLFSATNNAISEHEMMTSAQYVILTSNAAFTDSIKINRPGYNIRNYVCATRIFDSRPFMYVQQNIFEKTLIETYTYNILFKNILLYMNNRQSKIRLVHMYVITRTVYFDWICNYHFLLCSESYHIHFLGCLKCTMDILADGRSLLSFTSDLWEWTFSPQTFLQVDIAVYKT